MGLQTALRYRADVYPHDFMYCVGVYISTDTLLDPHESLLVACSDKDRVLYVTLSQSASGDWFKSAYGSQGPRQSHIELKVEEGEEVLVLGDRRFDKEWSTIAIDEKEQAFKKSVMLEAYHKYINDLYETYSFLNREKAMLLDDVLHFCSLIKDDKYADKVQEGLANLRTTQDTFEAPISLAQFMSFVLVVEGNTAGNAAELRAFLREFAQKRVAVLEDDLIRQEMVRPKNLKIFAQHRAILRDLYAALLPDRNDSKSLLTLMRTVVQDLPSTCGLSDRAIEKAELRLRNKEKLLLWDVAEAVLCLCLSGTANSLEENLEQVIAGLKIATFTANHINSEFTSFVL